MLKNFKIGLYLFLMLFSIAAMALPKEALSVFVEFNKVVLKLEQQHSVATNNLPSKYIEGLTALQKHYQSEGALDELLAVKKELARFQGAISSPQDPFELVPELPDDAIVSSPNALKLGQERYVADRKRIEETYLSEGSALSEELVKKLEAIQRDLTRRDLIDEALKIRDLIANTKLAIEDGSITEFSIRIAGRRPSEPNQVKAASNPSSGCPISRWTPLCDQPFSPSLHLLFHPDLLSTVVVSPHSVGSGFDFFATEGPSPQTVLSTLCREVGQAQCWRVNSLDDLAIGITATSHVLAQGRHGGPLLCVAVFSGKSLMASIRIPLTQKNMKACIIRDPSMPNRFALFCKGIATKQFELREGISVNVMVGVALVGARETCDTLIDFE